MRIAIVFTSRGAKDKAIGACWDNRAAATGISARHFARIDHEPLRHNPLNADKDVRKGDGG